MKLVRTVLIGAFAAEASPNKCAADCKTDLKLSDKDCQTGCKNVRNDCLAFQCEDNQDGSCTVDYVPTEEGDYDIAIKFSDEHVPGSPFKVK